MQKKTIHPFICISGNKPSVILYPLLCIFFLVIIVTDARGQNAFQKGRQFFDMRAAEADSFRAGTTNINKAIDAFNKALDRGIQPEQSAVYLLRAYYFKGMFTGVTEERQKEIYDRGRALGKRMMERFPKSVPVKFWYGANIGRWAKVYGFVKAATNGIAQKLRRVCKEIIEQDPQYQGGGGYRILAQVHFYSPNIPLLMGWPSDKKALKLIEKALNIAPDHPTNRMLYAEILLEFDRNKEARKQLQYILDMEPRSSFLVEDRYVKHRSRKLLEKHF